VYYSIPKPPNDADPITASFTSAYLAAYHVSPGVCSNTGFDAIRIIALAFDHGAHTGTEIQTQLRNLHDFPGAAGPTTFDVHGDVARPFAFMAIIGGKPSLVMEQPHAPSR
jgi:ABC-type branched-subunit amino acid transport system substrate-binding protein